MRHSLNALIVAVSLTFVVAPATLADDVTSCGAALLKAFGVLLQAQVKEATNACVAGSSNNAAPVNAAALTAAANKFNAAVTQIVADFGQVNCFVEIPADLQVPATFITSTQSTADTLCSPPVPTPTSTPP